MTATFSALLQYPKGLRVLGIDIDPVDLAEPIHVLIATTSRRAQCPHCGRYSHRVHSVYHRTLRDLACAGRSLIAHVCVHRFRCTAARCKTKVFCERLGSLAEPYARRTSRMNTSLVDIALSDGGRPGSRLAETLGLHANRMTLLRLVRSAPCLPASTPTVLGVDDFAFRRGHNYGTILYDIECHQVIELLPDRSAESLATWLRAHPGVEIISRDRAGIYAQGAREGSPGARQVADRWHLLNNLGEALERFVNQHQSALRLAVREDNSCPTVPEQTAVEPAAKPLQLNKAQEQIEHHRAARVARYEKIRRLYNEGHTKKEIAAHMGMGQSTVRMFLRRNEFPERAERPAVVGKLGPFRKHISEWWNDGNRDVKKLCGELKRLGYAGCRSGIYDYVQSFRQKNKPPCSLQAGVGKFSARQIVSSVLRPVRTPEQQTLLDRLTSKNPLFKMACDLAERFTALIRKTPREDAQAPLGIWATDAERSSVPSLASFASGLRADWQAVVAGLSMQWSNGAVEGAINRLKIIKREMYGRANFDLLRKRVLLAS
jgi:transposase